MKTSEDAKKGLEYEFRSICWPFSEEILELYDVEEERDNDDFFNKPESKKNEIHSHLLDTLTNLGDAIKKSQKRIERSC